MKTASCFLALIVTLFGLSTAAQAAPPKTHAVVQIQNNSSGNATIYYNWGNPMFGWKSFSLAAGKNLTLSHRYSGNSTSSPTLYVTFDTQMGSGTHYMAHSLARGAATGTGPTVGAKYVIKQVNSESRFIEAVNGPAAVTMLNKNAQKPLL